eukprot:4845684-Alexandrium_andersonii.AAC.1
MPETKPPAENIGSQHTFDGLTAWHMQNATTLQVLGGLAGISSSIAYAVRIIEHKGVRKVIVGVAALNACLVQSIPAGNI